MTEAAFGNSKEIITNQEGIHEKLTEVVEKHLATLSKKPFQQHTLDAFEQVKERLKGHKGGIILDACCGVGQSTRLIAKRHPEAFVIGVDKSAARINKDDQFLIEDTDTSQVDNFILVRADLNDFYRLLVNEKWKINKHFILYPNPWPKSKHLQRRWHGSAVFPQIIALGQTIELRSNWRLYLEEFLQAAKIAGRAGHISLVEEESPLTPFEAKYQASGQQCWQLKID